METFRLINGYDNYEISNLGNVRNTTTNKILKPIITKFGYCRVNLYKDKTLKNYYVHRILALTFLENIENKKEVDHINNIKTDNHLNNLRWVTHNENQQNTKINKNNSSRIKGVNFCKTKQKWQARVGIDSKRINLGYFNNISDAENAIKEARERLHGEYCNHG
jgi:hypothetical protein